MKAVYCEGPLLPATLVEIIQACSDDVSHVFDAQRSAVVASLAVGVASYLQAGRLYEARVGNRAQGFVELGAYD